ncbi:MAG: hypothetical protein C0629_16880 [Chromatiales bacterium]|nr:MAG: hypothetical protein C0629_16880 [Chromatiales bacterium]
METHQGEVALNPARKAGPRHIRGKPRWQVGDGCLNLHWFAGLQYAKEEIESWRNHYNHLTPHCPLGRKPPAVLAKEAA